MSGAHSDGPLDVCEPNPGQNLFMGEESESSSLGSFWVTAVL